MYTGRRLDGRAFDMLCTSQTIKVCSAFCTSPVIKACSGRALFAGNEVIILRNVFAQPYRVAGIFYESLALSSLIILMRYAIIVEYDGTRYAGFQIQKHVPTIQGELEKALLRILRLPIRISFAGRTDSGVHAKAQVISFALQEKLGALKKLGQSLNAVLPADIAVSSLMQVREDFHPRYTCLAREYEYWIWNHSLRCSLEAGRRLWLRQRLSVEKLNRELQSITGLHDFAAFTPPKNQSGSTKRHVYFAKILLQQKQDQEGALLCFRICANAFLHNMIRILLGSLIDIEAGRSALSLAEILKSRDRRLAGKTMPPQGLCFVRAYYPPKQEVLGNDFTGASLPLWEQAPSYLQSEDI